MSIGQIILTVVLVAVLAGALRYRDTWAASTTASPGVEPLTVVTLCGLAGGLGSAIASAHWLNAGLMWVGILTVGALAAWGLGRARKPKLVADGNIRVSWVPNAEGWTPGEPDATWAQLTTAPKAFVVDRPTGITVEVEQPRDSKAIGDALRKVEAERARRRA